MGIYLTKSLYMYISFDVWNMFRIMVQSLRCGCIGSSRDCLATFVIKYQSVKGNMLKSNWGNQSIIYHDIERKLCTIYTFWETKWQWYIMHRKQILLIVQNSAWSSWLARRVSRHDEWPPWRLDLVLNTMSYYTMVINDGPTVSYYYAL